MLTIDQATDEYQALRQPGDDHGIIGAYRTLMGRHGAENLPSLEAIMDRRCERSGTTP